MTTYDNTARTILAAAKNGDMDAVRDAITAGADVNCIAEDGDTALLLAARYGHCDIVRILCANGANVNFKNDEGDSALHQTSSRDIACLLIDHGADVDASNLQRRTPVFSALFCDDYELVNLLIERGAELNLKDMNGWTPLHCAVEAHQLDIARVLVENGADVLSVDNNGNTPLANVVDSDNIARAIAEATAQRLSKFALQKSMVRIKESPGRGGRL